MREASDMTLSCCRAVLLYLSLPRLTGVAARDADTSVDVHRYRLRLE